MWRRPCANAQRCADGFPDCARHFVDGMTASFSPLGGTVNVIVNDKLAGVPFAAAQVMLSIVVNGGVSGMSIASSGVVTIPSISPGSYAATYPAPG